MTAAISGNDAGNFSSIEVTFFNPNATSENTTAIWNGFHMDAAATPLVRTTLGGAYFLQGTDGIQGVQFLWAAGSKFKAQGDLTIWRRKRS